MKMLKRIAILIVVLLLVTIAAAKFYLQSHTPDYNVKVELAGLAGNVELYFDQYAIPHIYAENENDAYRALGYVQAQERLWQMELVRRIAPGRLSEVFGEATLKTDRFFRMIGLSEYTKESVQHFNESLAPPVREKVLAYLDGVNQFIDNGKTPLEFTIMGLEKTHFTPTDVYNITGYVAFSFAMAHKTEPILSHILEKYGSDYLADLDVHVDSNTTVINSGVGTLGLKELSMQVQGIMDGLPVSSFIGSNSWVVSGAKTKSGQVLFANDPHIGFSQPAVWYEAHLNVSGVNLYGYWMAGFPFPQLIHTDHHAIGLTMFENDDIDFFNEKQNPDSADQYQYKGDWLVYQMREETIRVKDGEDVKLTIKSTVHGPVMNDGIEILQNDAPISMWWVYLKHPNRTLEASSQLSAAQNMSEARAAASLIHAPGLNVMYGDVEGNVAWWAVAKLPKRPDHVNSKLILDGSTGNDDPLGYYDFSENPQAENPDWGYVYSANNQSVSPTGIRHPGYYLPEDRARRIVSLLETKDDWTADDFKTMITDVTSENAPEIVANLTAVIGQTNLTETEKGALETLKIWSGNFGLSQTGPTIYNKFIYHLVHNIFTDEIGDEMFNVFNGNHLMKRSMQPLFANLDSPWWDNVTTPNEQETRTEIINGAFKKTIEELVSQLGDNPQNWQWEKVHTLEHNHSFSAVPTLKRYFNVGPFPVPGNTETINNMLNRWQADGTYEVFGGPSTRRIVDFADVVGNSWSILPTGQSGNVLSDHYSDQAEMYSKGEFRRMLMGKEEIQGEAKYRAVFSPEKK